MTGRAATRVRLEHPAAAAPRAAMSAEKATAAILEEMILEDDTRAVIYGGTDTRSPIVLVAADSQRASTPVRTRMETLSPDDPRRVYLRHHRLAAYLRLEELRRRESYERYTCPNDAEPELVEYLRWRAARSAARAQVTDARIAAHLEGSIPAAVRAITEVLAAALEPDEMPELPHRRRRHTDDTAAATTVSVPTHAPHAPPVAPYVDHCRRSGITHRGRAPS